MTRESANTVPPAGPPLSILVVYPELEPLAPGGIVTVVRTLARQWREWGHGVTLWAAATWEHATLEYGEEEGIPCYRKRLRLPWDERRPWRGLAGFLREGPVTWREVGGVVERHGVDLIHLHALHHYQHYFLLRRRLGGPPCVVTLHGTDILRFGGDGGVGGASLRRVLGGADGVTAVAPALVEAWGAHFPGLSPPRLIPNGVAVGELARWARGPSPLASSDPYCLLVGHVEPVKGVETLIRAWGALGEQGRRVRLVVAGSVETMPGHVAGLRRLVGELGVGERVLFTGRLPREEVLALMGGASGVVIPSLREGLPNVLLEAGVAGVPVVASRIPPFTHYLEEGVTGWLVEPGAVAGWVQAVERLVAQPEVARGVGARWGERVAGEFSGQSMARGYLGLFRELLEGGEGKGGAFTTPGAAANPG